MTAFLFDMEEPESAPPTLPSPEPPVAHARTTDPSTSHEAAESITSDRISEVQKRIINVFDELGPMADESLVACYDPYDRHPATDASIRSRRAELVRLGKVVASGEFGTTPRGRRCIIWRLAG